MENGKINKISSTKMFTTAFDSMEHKPEIKNPHELKIDISLLQSKLIRLHDLGYVASLADSAIVLPVPLIMFGYASPNKTIEAFEKDKDFTQEYYKTNILTDNKLSKKADQLDELHKIISQLYPDFGKDMPKKVHQKDFENYRTQTSNFQNSLRNLMTYSPQIPSNEALIGKQDEIAAIIDTLDFAKACKTDDQFMYREYTKFIDKVNALPEQEQKVYTTPSISSLDGQTKLSPLELATSLKTDREKRIAKQNEIINLYKKINSKSFIKFKSAQTEEHPENEER